ncbi:MAG: amidohydrolase family protein, partial [Gammaproteobacteria bacterium]|nr:amidohydrolase family protein [Gammaproteobacteria bacterium]
AEDQTLVIADGRIASVGPDRGARIPKGVKVLDLEGRTVVPGLVMMHEHLVYPTDRSPDAERMYPSHDISFPRLYLAAGVTTMRTAGTAEPITDLNLKRDIESGRAVGPDIDVTSSWMDGSPPIILQETPIRDAAEARRQVQFWSAEGVTSFKVYMFLTREPMAAVIDEAHHLGHKVAGHLCAVTAREAAELGIDSLEHGLVVFTDFVPGKKIGECPDAEALDKVIAGLDVQSPPVRDLIRELVARHVAVDSTLAVFETDAKGRPPLAKGLLEVLTSDAQVSYLRRRARIADDPDNTGTILLAKEMEFEREFVAMGGQLLAGTDPTGYGGVIAGFGNWRELRLLNEAGFSAVEVFRIAALNGARFLGREDRIGSIAPGKQADLVVIRGNPAVKMTDMEDVELVFRAGVGYDSAKLVASARGLVGSR